MAYGSRFDPLLMDPREERRIITEALNEGARAFLDGFLLTDEDKRLLAHAADFLADQAPVQSAPPRRRRARVAAA